MDQKYESIIDDYLDPLAEYEQLFQTIFERTDEGIIVVEPSVEGRIIEANTAAAEMHGYSLQEFVKLKTSDFHKSQSRESAEEGIERMLNGEWVQIEGEHVRKNGSRFPVRFRAGTAQYLGRRVLICFIRDLTPQKQIEEALRQCEREISARI